MKDSSNFRKTPPEDDLTQCIPDTPDADDREDEKRHTVILFGRKYNKKKVLAAGLGCLLALALVGGGISYGIIQSPQNIETSHVVAKKDTKKKTQKDSAKTDDSKQQAETTQVADNTPAADTTGESEQATTDDTKADTNSGKSTTTSKTTGKQATTTQNSSTTNNNQQQTSSGNNSNSGGSTSSGGSSNSGSSKPQHTHNWVPKTSVIHHEAEYKTVHHDAVTKGVVVCNGCHKQFNTVDEWGAHTGTDVDAVRKCGSYHVEAIVVTPAWDEQVLVKNAWDETVTTGYYCSSCGAIK